MNTIQLQHSPFQNSLRLLASLILGAVITLLLFAMMYQMIKQEPVIISEPPPLVVINAILDIKESPTHIKTVIPKFKEPLKTPKTPLVVHNTPNENIGFSPVIKLPTGIGGKIALGQMTLNQQERPLVRVNPKYPHDAAQNGIEGYVVLSFGVSTAGEVVNIEVVEAQPKRIFDRAARQALRKWRYQPKMKQGTAIAMQGLQVKLDFTLDKS